MAGEASAKRRRTLAPDDLRVGTPVIYGAGEQRGVIKEAYVPLGEFWVADECSKELVRNEEGEVVCFRVEDLQLGDPVADVRTQGSAARVLLIGCEEQVGPILQHFGEPDVGERADLAQQMLAIPCSSSCCGAACARYDSSKRRMCAADSCNLMQITADAIEEKLFDLARTLRPDIDVRIRPYHLKQAMDRIGPALSALEGYYLLSAVTLPFGRDEITASKGEERKYKDEVRNQIDLGVSADGAHEAGEQSPEDTARRALREGCGIRLNEEIWSDEKQLALRQQLGVDMPLRFTDGPDVKVFILLIPDDATQTTQDVAGETLLLLAPPVDEVAMAPSATAGVLDAGGDPTVLYWKTRQEEFADLPKLPTGWIRIKSRSSGTVYYWDTVKNKSTFSMPQADLPEGWTENISKSTGKTYYFNAKLVKSVFVRPTE